MSELKDSKHEDTAARFLRHLAGNAEEAESQQLEQAVLEDDELFDRLTELESELVDAYAAGELDAETTRGMADLVGASPRLQARAETTLALATRHGEGSRLPRSKEPAASIEKSPPVRPFGLLGAAMLALALVAWLIVQAAGLRAELRELRVENARLREHSAALEETISRLEASNRSLTRRLARLEAESKR